MVKIPFLKILLVLSIFFFLLFLSIPAFAEINYVERGWFPEVMNCTRPCEECLEECEEITDFGIANYLDITTEEIGLEPNRWKFNIKPTEEFFDNYTLEDFENMVDTVRNLTSGLEIKSKKRIWKKTFTVTEEPFVINIRTLNNIERQGNCIEMTEFDGYFSAIGNETSYSNKYLGFTANVSLTAGWLAYGSTNLTGSDFSYLPSKTIKGETFNHIYHKEFSVIPNGTEKDFRFKVCFDSKPKFVVLYFGSASSVIKIDDDISNGIAVEVEFKDGFKNWEKIKFGKESVNYTSASDTIIITGDYTDNCFRKIYEADLANTTWNKTHYYNGTTFISEANINFGNFLTQDFNCTDEYINIQIGNSTHRRYFSMLGVSYNPDKSYFELNHSSLMIWNNLTNWQARWGRVNVTLYDTVIKWMHECTWCAPGYGGYTTKVNWEDTNLWVNGSTRFSFGSLTTAGSTLKNIIFYGGDALYIETSNIEWDDILIRDWERGFLISGTANATLRNAKFVDNTINLRRTQWFYPSWVKIIDSEINMSKEQSDLENNGTMYRVWTFNLDVTNETGHAIDGATVNITPSTTNDPDGVNCSFAGIDTSSTTNSTGQITEQNMTEAFYWIPIQENQGPATEYSCNPYILTISKPTYETYNTTISLTDKSSLTIALKRTLGSGSCDYDMSYNSTDNILTVVNGTTADAEISLQDIYDCDDYYAWGCVQTDDLLAYTFNCKLEIGNGTTQGATLVADSEKHITFPATIFTGNTQYFIHVKRYSNLRFGLMLDASKKLTYKGVQIIAAHPTAYVNIYIIYVYRDSTLDIFSSNFINTYRVGSRDFILGNRYATMNVYNTVLDGVRLQPLDGALGGSNDIYDVTIKNLATAVDRPKGATIDKILLYNNDYHLYFYTNYVSNVSNLIGINANIKSLYMREISVDTYLTDCEFDTWDFYWHGTSTAEVYRQYEFDLTVTNSTGDAIGGATVDINSSSTDPNCFNNATTTDANGIIDTQIVIMGYYNETGNETIYSCEPYYLTIKKPTYQSYLNTSMTFNEKTDLTIALKRTLGSGSCNTTKITQFDYNSTDKYLTIVGGTNGDEITLQDIYNCDDYYGYGCINTDDLVSYTFSCALQIGNNTAAGETWFADESKAITIPDGTPMHPSGGWMNVRGWGYVRFGALENETLRTTSRGCTFISQRSSDTQFIRAIGSPTNVSLYSSYITGETTSNNMYIRGRVWNSLFNQAYWYSAGGYWTIDAYNTRVERSAWGWHYATEGTFEDLEFVGVSGISDIGIYLYSSKPTVMKGVVIKGVWARPIRALDITVDKYLINPTLEDWTIDWGGTSTADIYRQYEFDLKVTNSTGDAISGATIDINSSSTDPKCFNNHTTTDVNGEIDTQTVTMGYYNETGDQTIYSCEPYYLTIAKPTYQTYLNTSMTFNTKTDFTIALRRTLGSGSCDVSASYDGTKITVTGGNNSYPVTAQDIYNCDDFNAWDCWTTEDLISYTQTCQIQIGDGSTYTSVAFHNISITQPDTFSAYYPLLVKNRANFTMGQSIDDTNHLTDSGVNLISYTPVIEQNVIRCDSGGARINIYDSKISFLGYKIGGYPHGFITAYCPTVLWNSIIEGAGLSAGGTGGVFDIYNVRVTHNTYGSNPLGGTSIEDVTMDNIGRGMQLFGGTPTTVASFKMRNVTESEVVSGKTFYRYVFARDISTDKFLQNGDIDKPWLNAIQYYCTAAGKCTAGVYINYTTDIKMIDNTSADLSRGIVGANVSWYNRTNGLMGSVLTDSNGEITTQSIPIYYAYENDSTTSCGSAIYDRRYCWTNYTEYQPIRFVITKPGYETLNFTANLTEKTDWTLALIEGVTELTLIKNIQYSDENSTHVNYTIIDQVINTGTLNVTSIAFQDPDISASFVIDNLGVNETNTTSGIVIVAKAMNNQLKTFVNASAIVNTTFYYSNQPSVLIPGTGGPADVNVSVPSSVTVGETITGNITIENQNPDIGQDFTVDYMITSLDESTNYSLGQKTVYVGASSTISTLGPLTAPSQAGTYKYKAVVYWVGGSASAFATFTVVEVPVVTPPGGGGFPIVIGEGKLEIIEYPSEMVVEQGGVEFYSLTIKNIGDGTLHNIEIILEGIPSEWYLTIPENLEELEEGKSQIFILKIKTPSTAKTDVTPVIIKALSDEDETWVLSKLIIKLIPVELIRIYDVEIATLNKLYKNEEGRITIFIENTQNKNITLTASLILPEEIDGNGEITKVIVAKAKATLEFDVLPKVTGFYNATLMISYDGKEISKNILLSVEEVRPLIPMLIWGLWEFVNASIPLLLLLLVSVCILLFYVIYKKIRKKRKLKRKKRKRRKRTRRKKKRKKKRIRKKRRKKKRSKR